MKQSVFGRAILSVAIAAISSIAAQPADAAFRLRISDATAQGTVITGATTEINVNPITVGQFNITGIVGDTTAGPTGALNLSGQISTETGGTLLMAIQNTGFTSPVAPATGLLQADITGILIAPSGSTATFTSFVNNMNAVPDLQPDQGVGAIAAIGPTPAMGTFSFAPIAFTVNGGGQVSTIGSGQAGFTNMAGAYSMFTHVSVVFTGAGSANFEIRAQAVPVALPSTLLLSLLGAPLIGLARRRAAPAITTA